MRSLNASKLDDSAANNSAGGHDGNIYGFFDAIYQSKAYDKLI